MRGVKLIPLALACLLAGCMSVETQDPAPGRSDSVSLMPAGTVPRPVAALPASRDSGALSPTEAQIDLAADAAEGVPFVRSQPHKAVPFPLVLNGAVQRYVESFAAHSTGIKNSFRRSRPYLSMMVRVLENHDLPPDLVYLSFAESSFSSQGAGPWQLSKATARRFHLTVNKYVDERRDPIKSTQAAAEYLTALHDEAGDWHMALVGWNRGEATLDQYWRLRGVEYSRLTEHLPYNTRSLLNRFMAVAIIAQEPERYGIEPVDYSEPSHFRYIRVDGGTPLKDVADRTGISEFELRDYNPALLHDRVPPGPGSYELRLPVTDTAQAESTTSF
jgi:membrane-bound lytic murein transglycosylase D